ncbi:MAG: ASCH domain-containing protein [Christensenellales bacterium]
MNDAIKEFWRKFLENSGLDESIECSDCFCFELSESSANKLLELVLSGEKRATSSSALAYGDAEAIPKVGQYSIVTDWGGRPRCVIKTTRVRIVPFKDITYEMCILEGEDDTLESWRNGHRRFFITDGERSGYDFTDDMPVVFEEFENVFSE